MRAQYFGESDSLGLEDGKIYDVLSIEGGWFRVVDGSEEDYLYPSDIFQIVDGKIDKDLGDGLKEYVEAETGVKIDDETSKADLEKAYKKILDIAIEGTEKEEDDAELSPRTKLALEVLGVPNEWFPEDE